MNDHRAVDVVARTDPGRVRELNEDAVAYRVPSDPDELRAKGILCLLTDGMGGHAAGEIASQIAIDTVLQSYFEDPGTDAVECLRAAIQTANSVVHEQTPDASGGPHMGTTLVGSVLQDGVLHVANVGDSRAYLVQAGRIEQITEDHSWVQEQIRAGVLTEEQARTHPRRNVVTRALGLEPEVEIDTFRRMMEPGDVLILCSDGLWEVVQDAELQQIILQHRPEKAAQLLIDTANRRGGPDNISLVILKRRKPPSGPAPEADAAVPTQARVAGEATAVFGWLAAVREQPMLGMIALTVTILIVLVVAGVVWASRREPTASPTPAATQPAAAPRTTQTAERHTATAPPATATLRPTNAPGADTSAAGSEPAVATTPASGEASGSGEAGQEEEPAGVAPPTEEPTTPSNNPGDLLPPIRTPWFPPGRDP